MYGCGRVTTCTRNAPIQHKEDKLGIEGLGVIKTLINSETSLSVFTFIIYKTVLLIIIVTSIIYIYNIIVSLYKLIFYFYLRRN